MPVYLLASNDGTRRLHIFSSREAADSCSYFRGGEVSTLDNYDPSPRKLFVGHNGSNFVVFGDRESAESWKCMERENAQIVERRVHSTCAGALLSSLLNGAK